MALAFSDVVKIRARLKAAIREFFGQKKFLEIDTPIGVIAPGAEIHLQYFETAWRDLRGDAHRLFLRSSPELHMKQALAHAAEDPALGRIFQLAPCFRSGGELSAWHHPEFLMLEFYEAGIAFERFIDRTEELFRTTRAACEPLTAKLRGAGARAAPEKFQRISVAEAVKRWAGVKLIDGDPDLAKKARENGLLSPRADDDFETAFFKILIERVEPGLAAMPDGAVLSDYPASQAALATVENGVAKRFEFYCGRVELCNGFKELILPAANRTRIAAINARRRALGYVVPDEDQDFYRALDRGLPECCGNAVGVERWLALLIGAAGIEELVPFRGALPYARFGDQGSSSS